MSTTTATTVIHLPSCGGTSYVKATAFPAPPSSTDTYQHLHPNSSRSRPDKQSFMQHFAMRSKIDGRRRDMLNLGKRNTRKYEEKRAMMRELNESIVSALSMIDSGTVEVPVSPASTKLEDKSFAGTFYVPDEAGNEAGPAMESSEVERVEERSFLCGEEERFETRKEYGNELGRILSRQSRNRTPLLQGDEHLQVFKMESHPKAPSPSPTSILHRTDTRSPLLSLNMLGGPSSPEISSQKTTFPRFPFPTSLPPPQICLPPSPPTALSLALQTLDSNLQSWKDVDRARLGQLLAYETEVLVKRRMPDGSYNRKERDYAVYLFEMGLLAIRCGDEERGCEEENSRNWKLKGRIWFGNVVDLRIGEGKGQYFLTVTILIRLDSHKSTEPKSQHRITGRPSIQITWQIPSSSAAAVRSTSYNRQNPNLIKPTSTTTSRLNQVHHHLHPLRSNPLAPKASSPTIPSSLDLPIQAPVDLETDTFTFRNAFIARAWFVKIGRVLREKGMGNAVGRDAIDLRSDRSKRSDGKDARRKRNDEKSDSDTIRHVGKKKESRSHSRENGAASPSSPRSDDRRTPTQIQTQFSAEEQNSKPKQTEEQASSDSKSPSTSTPSLPTPHLVKDSLRTITPLKSHLSLEDDDEDEERDEDKVKDENGIEAKDLHHPNVLSTGQLQPQTQLRSPSPPKQITTPPLPSPLLRTSSKTKPWSSTPNLHFNLNLPLHLPPNPSPTLKSDPPRKSEAESDSKTELGSGDEKRIWRDKGRRGGRVGLWVEALP